MKYVVCCFLLVLSLGTTAQTYRAYLRAAEIERAEEDHYGAMTYYGEALKIEEEAWGTWYEFAESARKFMAYQVAANAYPKVYTSADSLEFPLALYHHAEMEKQLGNYERAESLFQKFLQTGRGDAFHQQRAVAELESIGFALELMSETDDRMIVSKLPAKFATPYSEFAPVQRGDHLYLSAFAYPRSEGKLDPERLYSKVLISREGGKPLPYDALNDTLRHTANLTFNTAGTQVYYTLCDYTGPTQMRCELYRRAVNADGSLGAPEALPASVNAANSTNTQPSIGRDARSGRELLFFSSDRAGGRGGMDIWCSVLTTTGGVGVPVNVTEVNTEFDEITPAYNANTQTLYFSSDRLEGLGGYDVFSAKRENGTYEAPLNLGQPVNTSFHETYYWMNEAGNSGYFASNRPKSKKLDTGSGACCYDLYRVEFMEVGLFARIYDGKLKTLLTDANLRIAEILPDGSLGPPVYERTGGGGSGATPDAPNDDDGTFRVPLERGKRYQLIGSRAGFLPRVDTVSLVDGGGNNGSDTEGGGGLRVRADLYLPPEKLDLLVSIFDAEEETPLPGVTEFYSIDGTQISMIEHEDHRFEHTLDRDKTYQIILDKPGYHPDTLVYDRLNPMEPPYVLNERVLLRPKDITEFPPLTLYFDNGQPNRANINQDYGQIYEVYYGRRDDFLREYSALMDGKNNNAARNRRIMELFFDREIQYSFEELEFLTDRLLKELRKGTPVRVTLKGYTSPLGNADFNQLLSERRIQTVRNYFDRYRGGAFASFLGSGQFQIVNEPFGESQASNRVSDLLDDEGESVYGIGASRERRVEIIGVERLPNN